MQALLELSPVLRKAWVRAKSCTWPKVPLVPHYGDKGMAQP